MKYSLYLIPFFFLFFSCVTPEWEKKGFESEEKYKTYLIEKAKAFSDSIFQLHWANDDEKFIGVYTNFEKGGYSPYEYEKTLTMEILEDGYGKFDEKQFSVDKGYTTFGDDDTFNWTKLDDETISITGLQGSYSYGEYRFDRYNGKYKISKRLDIKSSNDFGYHEFTNLNTGDSFDRTNSYYYDYNLNQGPVKESITEDKIEPEKDPEPKFMIYSGTITVPYYADNPEFGGVTNYYTLKLSLDYDKASLDGPMTRIREIEYGYKFIEGQLSGIWFFPTNEYVMIMNKDNSEFGKLTFDKYEYENSKIKEYDSEIVVYENQSPSVNDEIIYEDEDLVEENEEFSYDNENVSYTESEIINSEPISYIKINDPDGYTNVRSGKSTSTDIIHQIYDENKLFELIDDSENWWEIKIHSENNEAKTGFIYYTKVLKVESFTVAVEKAYFHLQANIDSQNKTYVIKGDNLLCHSNIENGFRNCTYINSKGVTTNGYVIANQLK